MAFAPLAPEAPEFAGLLVSLLALAGAMVALGMVTILDAAVKATVGTVGHLLGKVPLIGGYLSSPVNAVYHWMNHLFGAAEVALDGVIAFWLHSLGSLVQFLARQIRGDAHLLWMLGNVLLGSTAVDRLDRLVGRIVHDVAAASRSAEHALGRLAHLEATLPGRIEGVVLPRLRAIDHVLDWTIPHDIAGLRARSRALLDRLENVWQQTRKMDALLGTAALTGALAFALTRLDLNWIRCRNWNRIGKAACGLPLNLIEDILAGAIDVLVIEDLCTLIGLGSAVYKEVEPALFEFVTVADALVGCHGASKPPPLTLSVTALPPVPQPLPIG